MATTVTSPPACRPRQAAPRVWQLPPGDPRSKLIQVTIKKNQARPDALIQILHVAQNLYGYLPENVLRFITQELKLVPSRVYGVATFYHFFSLKPRGEHTCLVCTGTACYVKGAQAILDEIERRYHLRPGEVTPDNQLGLQTARCLGACGLAPAVVVDQQVLAKVQPQTIQKVLDQKTARPS